MKNQDLFSSKDKSKKLKCCLLQFLFGALRVKARWCIIQLFMHFLLCITQSWKLKKVFCDD